jgi:exodeoxyribonuclease VII large subunit
MNLFSEDRTASEALTLSELNGRLEKIIRTSMPAACWLKAETSDVRLNASSGHCYLEFVEKDELSGQVAAKARGMIWARTFQLLKPYFEEATGQPFTSGLNVLVKVTVEFHKLYGYSLTVLAIEPAYTLGDLVRKRQETVRRLQEEGIFDLNRELPLPELPQRIAVITSPNAAGYGDFENQLLHNSSGYPFYIKLFPAVMQGEKTEASIIAAFDRICDHAALFDVVVLIRGGGAASELHCFDSYSLAAHCAQFPLPVITGIGHERDDSIVDMVAHTRMKTPTAVAAFLIERMDEQAALLNSLQQAVCSLATGALTMRQTQISLLIGQLPALAIRRIERSRAQLQYLRSSLPVTQLVTAAQRAQLAETRQRLLICWTKCVSDQLREMELTDQFLKMSSPKYVLQRGYTLILKEGKIVKHASALAAGDSITARFADGERIATVQ